MQGSACVEVPDAQGGVTTGGDYVRLCGMNDEFNEITDVAAKGVLQIGGLGGPYLDEIIVAAGDDKASSVVEEGGKDGQVVTDESFQWAISLWKQCESEWLQSGLCG